VDPTAEINADALDSMIEQCPRTKRWHLDIVLRQLLLHERWRGSQEVVNELVRRLQALNVSLYWYPAGMTKGKLTFRPLVVPPAAPGQTAAGTGPLTRRDLRLTEYPMSTSIALEAPWLPKRAMKVTAGERRRILRAYHSALCASEDVPPLRAYAFDDTIGNYDKFNGKVVRPIDTVGAVVKCFVQNIVGGKEKMHGWAENARIRATVCAALRDYVETQSATLAQDARTAHALHDVFKRAHDHDITERQAEDAIAAVLAAPAVPHAPANDGRETQTAAVERQDHATQTPAADRADPPDHSDRLPDAGDRVRPALWAWDSAPGQPLVWANNGCHLLQGIVEPLMAAFETLRAQGDDALLPPYNNAYLPPATEAPAACPLRTLWLRVLAARASRDARRPDAAQVKYMQPLQFWAAAFSVKLVPASVGQFANPLWWAEMLPFEAVMGPATRDCCCWKLELPHRCTDPSCRRNETGAGQPTDFVPLLTLAAPRAAARAPAAAGDVEELINAAVERALEIQQGAACALTRCAPRAAATARAGSIKSRARARLQPRDHGAAWRACDTALRRDASAPR
jgi:hypothetical protein